MTRTSTELIIMYGSLSSAIGDGWSYVAGNVYEKKKIWTDEEDADDNPFVGAWGIL